MTVMHYASLQLSVNGTRLKQSDHLEDRPRGMDLKPPAQHAHARFRHVQHICIFSGFISWEMIYEAETKCNYSPQALCYCLTHSRPAIGNLLVLRRIVKESRAEKHQVYANLFSNSESYNFLLEEERHQFRNICSFPFLLQRASGGL